MEQRSEDGSALIGIRLEKRPRKNPTPAR